MDWQDKIAAQLDKDLPRWVIEWMSHEQAQAIIQSGDSVRETERVRRLVIRRIIEPIVRASITAGVVKGTE